ncbi:hypothetical protein AAG570_006949 [Ranatra chinensis]|uniref:Uncharacterized protein n=1 Tax=Ranatra chinensis TaxID=642074 RepID=A0ABD0Z866_9HEMI
MSEIGWRVWEDEYLACDQIVSRRFLRGRCWIANVILDEEKGEGGRVRGRGSQEIHALGVFEKDRIQGRSEIWDGDDWQTIELRLHSNWPRSCQDNEVGLGQDVIGETFSRVPQGAVMGTEGNDVGVVGVGPERGEFRA